MSTELDFHLMTLLAMFALACALVIAAPLVRLALSRRSRWGVQEVNGEHYRLS